MDVLLFIRIRTFVDIVCCLIHANEWGWKKYNGIISFVTRCLEWICAHCICFYPQCPWKETFCLSEGKGKTDRDLESSIYFKHFCLSLAFLSSFWPWNKFWEVITILSFYLLLCLGRGRLGVCVCVWERKSAFLRNFSTWTNFLFLFLFYFPLNFKEKHDFRSKNIQGAFPRWPRVQQLWPQIWDRRKHLGKMPNFMPRCLLQI